MRALRRLLADRTQYGPSCGRRYPRDILVRIHSQVCSMVGKSSDEDMDGMMLTVRKGFVGVERTECGARP